MTSKALLKEWNTFMWHCCLMKGLKCTYKRLSCALTTTSSYSFQLNSADWQNAVSQILFGHFEKSCSLLLLSFPSIWFQAVMIEFRKWRCKCSNSPLYIKWIFLSWSLFLNFRTKLWLDESKYLSPGHGHRESLQACLNNA